MPDNKTPGVYIEEIPVFPPSVPQVQTSVPLFIGYTEKADDNLPGDLLLVPKRISAIPDYERYYGKSSTSGDFNLYHSLSLYFSNGGSKCYIISAGTYNDSIKKSDFILSLDAADKIDEPTLLVFPDAVHLPGNDLYEVQQAALEQAARLGDRFCILDIKPATTKQEHDTAINEFRNQIGVKNLSYGAAYTPHLLPSFKAGLILPPSGAIAGVYCRVDNTRGVWKAPANVAINSVTDVLYPPGNAEQESLNVDPVAGKSINVLRKFSGKGILVWGARTLNGNDNEWRYISVRRLFNMVEESVKKGIHWFVFEPNDANTWVKVRAMVENFLFLLWRQGALHGSKPEHAYYVKTGLGTTMTAQDILDGKLIVEIGVAVVRPAEFIVIRIIHQLQQS